jgi:putative membrane protein
MKKYSAQLLLFLKGMAMGAADVVPGVSGGTIAFITGIYEQLLNAIKSVDGKAIKKLSKREFTAFWTHVDGNFLVVLVSGILFSVLSLARLIHYLLDTHPIQLWSFFFGLVLISAIIVFKTIKKWKWQVVLSAVAGCILAWVITTSTPATMPDGAVFVFIAGAIAICAMILPGISGSFILLILGKYEYIINALKEVDLVTIGIFLAGCVVGLLSFARVVSWALKKYHDLTIALLAGFMIGSLKKIWPWKETLSFRINSKGEEVPLLQQEILPTDYLSKTGSDPYLFQALFFAALGILIVIGIEKYAAYMKKEPHGHG